MCFTYVCICKGISSFWIIYYTFVDVNWGCTVVVVVVPYLKWKVISCWVTICAPAACSLFLDQGREAFVREGVMVVKYVYGITKRYNSHLFCFKSAHFFDLHKITDAPDGIIILLVLRTWPLYTRRQ